MRLPATLVILVMAGCLGTQIPPSPSAIGQPVHEIPAGQTLFLDLSPHNATSSPLDVVVYEVTPSHANQTFRGHVELIYGGQTQARRSPCATFHVGSTGTEAIVFSDEPSIALSDIPAEGPPIIGQGGKATFSLQTNLSEPTVVIAGLDGLNDGHQPQPEGTFELSSSNVFQIHEVTRKKMTCIRSLSEFPEGRFASTIAGSVGTDLRVTWPADGPAIIWPVYSSNLDYQIHLLDEHRVRWSDTKTIDGTVKGSSNVSLLTDFNQTILELPSYRAGPGFDFSAVRVPVPETFLPFLRAQGRPYVDAP